METSYAPKAHASTNASGKCSTKHTLCSKKTVGDRIPANWITASLTESMWLWPRFRLAISRRRCMLSSPPPEVDGAAPDERRLPCTLRSSSESNRNWSPASSSACFSTAGWRAAEAFDCHNHDIVTRRTSKLWMSIYSETGEERKHVKRALARTWRRGTYIFHGHETNPKTM